MVIPVISAYCASMTLFSVWEKTVVKLRLARLVSLKCASMSAF